MNLLLIEDEPGFVEKVRQACADTSTNLLTPESAELKGLNFDDGSPVEDQLARMLDELINKHAVDLVLLDTDLSRDQKALRTQTEYRLAFQTLGVPVCRYRKGHSLTKIAAIEELRRIGQEGASAVWVPKMLTSGDAKDLIPWLEKIEQGFRQLTDQLTSNEELLRSPSGPSGILARLLDRESLRSDLLGYTSQNSFFFASGDANSVRLRATQLGYWLCNYILMFPGPILSRVAAAAFLNISPASFAHEKVQTLVRPALYMGPFSGLEFYWRDELANLLDDWEGDIAQAKELADLKLERIDPDAPGRSAYFCVLDKEAIKESEAAEVNPDWIPPGAQLS